MSAILHPAPVRAPEAPAALPVAPAPPSRPKRLWIALAALVLAAAAAGLWLSRGEAKPQQAVALRTHVVARGPIARVLRATGVTTARNYASIAAPMLRGPEFSRSLVLTRLVKAGSFVSKGDLIVEIDSQQIKDHVDDVESSVQQAQADIRKRQAEHAIEMENLRQNLRLAQAELEKARLDNSAAEIRTSIDVELLKLSVEEADAAFRQIQKDIQITGRMHDAEIKILEYTRERHVRHRDRHRGDIVKLSIRAPIAGLAVMNSVWRSGDMGQIQEGDQVSPGQPFMKIVDPSSMLVDATVNQVDSETIRIGQTAAITFDAFPGLRLEGRVENVAAMAVGGWRQNYYIRNLPLRISILKQDPRVIPDLSAAAEIVLERKEGVLLLPLEAVKLANGVQVARVKQGEQFVAREVKLGLRNQTYTEVLAGLQEGQEVLLSEPPPPRGGTPES
ncbi:MAG: HlyD family efflux transporter periplasmic adaptor subunit [Acidobacteria bacterium]|nr:HlyD family efflux transporter periplasmic adaptor subunit [Acidobacteriota bacterium]